MELSPSPPPTHTHGHHHHHPLCHRHHSTSRYWAMADAMGSVGAELAASDSGEEGRAPKRKIEVEVPQWAGEWVVGMDQYREGLVGAKSKNIAGATPSEPRLHILNPKGIHHWRTV